MRSETESAQNSAEMLAHKRLSFRSFSSAFPISGGPAHPDNETPIAQSRKIRLFRACEKGAALIEFAFIAPILIALIIATLEVCLTFFAQQLLESTTERAARQILTGQAQKQGMSQNAFKTIVCDSLPSFMTCNNVLIDVSTAASFSAINLNNYTITLDSSGNPTNSFSFNMGNPGDIVVMRVMYIWPVVAAPLGFDLSDLTSGKKLLVSTAVFKSEPY